MLHNPPPLTTVSHSLTWLMLSHSCSVPCRLIGNLIWEHLPDSVHPVELVHIFQGPLPRRASLTQAWNCWVPTGVPVFFSEEAWQWQSSTCSKIPSLSDTFSIFIMVEITAGRICFSREVGIGSLLYDLVAIPLIIFLTSSSETSLNCLSTSLGLVVDLLGSILCDVPENLLSFGSSVWRNQQNHLPVPHLILVRSFLWCFQWCYWIPYIISWCLSLSTMILLMESTFLADSAVL